MSNTVTFSPVTPNGQRLNFQISDEQWQQFVALGKDETMRVDVIGSSVSYKVAKAPCGADCYCDAIVTL